MDITPISASASNIITNAQFKAANAAQTIAEFSVTDNEVGGSEITPNSLFTPISELDKAETEAKAGVKILQAEQEMLGSLFDATI